MIPMKTSTVFKSRWMALLWAVGIIWFAYDFVGAQPQDGNDPTNARSGDPTDAALANADANKLTQELNAF